MEIHRRLIAKRHQARRLEILSLFLSLLTASFFDQAIDEYRQLYWKEVTQTTARAFLLCALVFAALTGVVVHRLYPVRDSELQEELIQRGIEDRQAKGQTLRNLYNDRDV